MDIEKSEELLTKVKNEVERKLGEISLALNDILFKFKPQELTILEKYRNEIECSGLLATFQLNCISYYYQFGLNEPNNLNAEKLSSIYNHIKEIKQSLVIEDDNTRSFVNAQFEFIECFQSMMIGNLERAILHEDQGINFLREIYDFPPKYSINRGEFLIGLGKFEEAEEDLKANWRKTKSVITLGHKTSESYCTILVQLYMIQGRYSKAREIILEGIELGEQHDNYNLSRRCIYLLAELSLELGDFKTAEKAYLDHIEICKKSDNPRHYVLSLLDLSNYYEKRFKSTKDDDYLEKAQQYFEMIKDIGTNPSDDMINISLQFQKAKILSHGTILEKAEALSIFEELANHPLTLDIYFAHLDLLFQDYLISESQKTIDKINGITDKIRQLPLANNPRAIREYTKQQLLKSKYDYFVSQNSGDALETLYNLKDRLNQLKLPNLISIVENEILKYESDRSKWENMNATVKNRIFKSKIRDYVRDAKTTFDI